MFNSSFLNISLQPNYCKKQTHTHACKSSHFPPLVTGNKYSTLLESSKTGQHSVKLEKAQVKLLKPRHPACLRKTF